MRSYATSSTNGSTSKAIAQAHRAAAAIRDGSWPLRELFGKPALALPRSVTPCVLTWWDTYNPTLGSEGEIISCNFATFVHVISAVKGDVSAAITAIRELARIYCPGVLHHLKRGRQRAR